MRVVILAGGRGTRLQEETTTRPKPMVEIGGRPILWHIMKHYAHHQFNEFIIALGYLGDDIKDYFLKRYNLSGNLTVDFAHRTVEREESDWEHWLVHLVDTGASSETGGRIQRLRRWLTHETFMVTYGDGVSDVNLTSLAAFHRAHGRIATVTAVRPPARFGGLEMDGDVVTTFSEKPLVHEGWINGGFLIFEPAIFDYLTDDSCRLETNVLSRLAADGQLCAYRHDRFWQCMDTVREKCYLESLWQAGKAPWMTWDDPHHSRSSRKVA